MSSCQLPLDARQTPRSILLVTSRRNGRSPSAFPLCRRGRSAPLLVGRAGLSVENRPVYRSARMLPFRSCRPSTRRNGSSSVGVHTAAGRTIARSRRRERSAVLAATIDAIGHRRSRPDCRRSDRTLLLWLQLGMAAAGTPGEDECPTLRIYSRDVPISLSRNPSGSGENC